MEPKSLTQHLLALDPDGFKKATQTKFLEEGGKGILSEDVLGRWLSQDRLYAQAYIRFAAHIISQIQLPAKVEAGDINERLLDLFIDALTNVRSEIKFFERTAGRYGLGIDAEEESEAVGEYKTLFEETAEKGDMLRTMVLLWGTEKCYLEAWRYAQTFEGESQGKEDADGGALRKEFIPNWTSTDFVQFVDRIEGLLQEVWGNEGGKEREIGKVEELWGRILVVEGGFWPSV